MNSSKKNIIILLLVGYFSCVGDDSAFPDNHKYIGFWAETKWIYNFDQNGTYILESEGHGGGDPKSGKYVKRDRLILLISDTEYFEDMRLKRMRISDDGCLRDYWNHVYCEDEEQLMQTAEKAFEESLSMENIIRELEIIQSTRKKLMRQDSLDRYTVQFEGIVLINGDEYFEYNLKSWLPEYRTHQIHLRLYSKLNPIRIYDDNLELIKEIETAANTR